MKINFGEKISLPGYEREFKCGDIVKHFKRETLKETDDPMSYLYQIIGVATDATTEEEGYQPMVVYKALYGGKYLFVRTIQDFFSKVDKDKYPNIKQEYRFEVV